MKPTKSYILRATAIFEAALKEIPAAYFTALLLQPNTFLGPSTLADTFVLLLLRPRNAFLIGILGTFEPWAGEGPAALAVDLVITCVAGTLLAVRYKFGELLTLGGGADVSWDQHGDLVLLGAGAVLYVAPAAVMLLASLVGVLISSFCCGTGGKERSCAGTIFAWALGAAAAGVVVGLAPVVALIEMVVAVVTRAKGGNNNLKGCFGRFLAEGMEIDSSGFRLFYRLALMGSWGTAVGS